MKRLARAALVPLVLLFGCAAPPAGGGGGSGTPASVGAAVRPAALPQCVAENQECDTRRHCCQGLVCEPTGRFGFLCRTPYPG
jgi:hypothetical protein